MKKIGICTILLAVSACGGEQSTVTTTSTTTITESSIGSSTSMQSTSTLRSKVTLGSYEIDQQKTIQSGTDYITFTKVIQYFRRNQ